MLSLFLILAVAYFALAAYMFAFQRRLMYHPDKNIGAPETYGLSGFKDFSIPSGNLSLQAWYKPAQAGFPTILYLHGNAGHIGTRSNSFAALTRQGFGLFSINYRGFGKSEGYPSEAGIYNDARAAMHYLTEELKLPLSNILLYGESLGSGVAVQMATEFAVSAIVLEAPYTSVAGRAAEIYYYVPVWLLIRDRYDSLSKIGRVKAPILLFHGERDQVIPVVHGRRLLEAATSPKRGFFFPQTAHNDFDTGVISSHVLEFAREHHLITA